MSKIFAIFAVSTGALIPVSMLAKVACADMSGADAIHQISEGLKGVQLPSVFPGAEGKTPDGRKCDAQIMINNLDETRQELIVTVALVSGDGQATVSVNDLANLTINSLSITHELIQLFETQTYTDRHTDWGWPLPDEVLHRNLVIEIENGQVKSVRANDGEGSIFDHAKHDIQCDIAH